MKKVLYTIKMIILRPRRLLKNYRRDKAIEKKVQQLIAEGKDPNDYYYD